MSDYKMQKRKTYEAAGLMTAFAIIAASVAAAGVTAATHQKCNKKTEMKETKKK